MWKLILIIYLILINFTALVIYGIDKRRAIKQKYRISESTLLLFAAVGGSIGALSGMRLFRHKTQKRKFTIGVPVILALQIILAILLITWYGTIA